MKISSLLKLESLSYKIRKVALETSYYCKETTHIGGALSIVDIMAVLYGKIIHKANNNRFILSKGHGFLGLLSALHCVGKISKKKLKSYQTNGSELIAHPILNKKLGIESSNGSLGQGLSFGCGMAISYKKKNKNGNIYVLIGDGECYEGSIWESAITATEQKLDNLFVILDCNGFQNDGKIGNMMTYKNLLNKWRGFGWNVKTCDGHDLKKILENLSKRSKNKPTILIAKTKKGKGVSFMENNNDWHHNRLTEKLLKVSLKNIK